MAEYAPALLRRHGQRGSYDIETAQAVFDDSFIAHVSYVDDGLPACMPMIALMREEEEEEKDEEKKDGKGRTVVYLHGHPSTRLMELVRQASQEDKPTEPVKVCITATKVDGLVLSSAPNGHTFNYRAATVHGTCGAVRSKAAKRAVMRAVTDKTVAGRWAEVNPVASLQVSLVYVVRVQIDKLSVKTRAGVPGIQPRDRAADGADHAVAPWTGVVPLWEQLGAPVASGLTPEATMVPASLQAYIAERNERQRSHAEQVAR